MARKTVDVKTLIDITNDMLKNSFNSSTEQEQRWGAILLLEGVLHRTGNYRGYRYLDSSEVESGFTVGVNYVSNADGVMVPHPDYEERFRDCDDTRRVYHYHG